MRPTKHFVHVFDDGWKFDRHVFGIAFKSWAVGVAWITRYTERPKLVKVPGTRHWRRLCVFLYRLGFAYRFGDFSASVPTETEKADPSCCEDDERCVCGRCGGEGFIEYADGDQSDWGEDCSSEENHLIVCRECNGTGRI